MLRSVWYFCLLVGVTLLCVSVLVSVEFGLFILIIDYSSYNVIGVFQVARSRRLDSAWLGVNVCCSCFLVEVGELSLCVTESVNSGCYVLMGCNCFVCAVVGSSKVVCSRRVRWGRLGVALPELCLVGSR